MLAKSWSWSRIQWNVAVLDTRVEHIHKRQRGAVGADEIDSNARAFVVEWIGDPMRAWPV